MGGMLSSIYEKLLAGVSINTRGRSLLTILIQQSNARLPAIVHCRQRPTMF